MQNVIENARGIASRAHAGQRDKAGMDYISHPARVAERVRAAGGTDEGVATAWLHDVLEDTNVTAGELRKAGIPDTVIDAVKALTKQRGESLERYCARVRANDLALVVKRADLDDNQDPRRTAALDHETRQRLAAKYARVRDLLGLPSMTDQG